MGSSVGRKKGVYVGSSDGALDGPVGSTVGDEDGPVGSDVGSLVGKS